MLVSHHSGNSECFPIMHSLTSPPSRALSWSWVGVCGESNSLVLRRERVALPAPHSPNSHGFWSASSLQILRYLVSQFEVFGASRKVTLFGVPLCGNLDYNVLTVLLIMFLLPLNLLSFLLKSGDISHLLLSALLFLCPYRFVPFLLLFLLWVLGRMWRQMKVQTFLYLIRIPSYLLIFQKQSFRYYRIRCGNFPVYPK